MSGPDDAERSVAPPATPSWLTTPCPSWCRRAHGEDDHPEDRYHQSESTILVAVAGSGDTVPVSASLVPVTLVVRVGQYPDAATWVLVEPAEGRHPRIALSPESARDLAAALLAQVDGLAGGDLGAGASDPRDR
ncbi:hypothetical protein FHP29_07300 [Nocardioides albidus]|uniref:Uncharacterized protein n=1 Tax=Nocardioides albidus TaxID=1517589 RepID=A0A5C4W3N1_9ACTN|nr:hypothetical protein [Nocardioides albidus]TNM42800.1 hypothetical protein FHP29_07300 [Nocardioides albidus]